MKDLPGLTKLPAAPTQLSLQATAQKGLQQSSLRRSAYHRQPPLLCQCLEAMCQKQVTPMRGYLKCLVIVSDSVFLATSHILRLTHAAKK